MASLYYYTARSADGRFVRGSVEATTPAAAIAGLRMRALCVTSVEDASTRRGALASVFHAGPIRATSVVAFFRSFATLAGAGVSMRRALGVTAEQCRDGRLREALGAVLSDVENGLALSEAMSRRPREFPQLFIAVIRAGEAGGVLDEVADRLATLLERERAAKKRLAAALTYPAIVAASAVALVAFLLTSIIPAFAQMYAQMHVPLPAVTSMLISVTAVLRSPVLWSSVAAVTCAAVLLLARSREARLRALRALLFKIPAVGTIAAKAATGRLARVLGTLLRSGVSLVAALEVTRGVVSETPYAASLDLLRNALAEGSALSRPLADCGLYEPLFVQLVQVGEETGALDAMLLRIAEYYDTDVETALATLAGLVEPAVILLLGSVVGFIVAAIFIPLYTLIGSIK